MDASGRASVTPRPVAQYLVRFGSADQFGVVDEPQAAFVIPSPLELEKEDRAPPIEIRQDDCETASIGEMQAAAYAEHAAALAQERLLFEERLFAARTKWSREEGDILSQKTSSAFAEIEARIASGVASALRIFLSDLLRRRAVEDLAGDIRVLLEGGEHPVIEISGPADLLDALREKLSGSSGAIAYAPNASADVKVVADQTLIDSRIEAWVDRLKALAE
jgi:hypothetical protein